MARAIRSLTLPPGFSDSSFPRTIAHAGLTTRRSRTNGVSPMRSSALETSRAMFSPSTGSNLVGDPLFGLGPYAITDVGQRRVIHDGRYRIPHLGPDIPQHAKTLLGAVLLGSLGYTEDRRDRTAHCPKDLAQGDLSRRLGQVVPP